MRNDVPFKFLATSNRRCRTLFQFCSGFCLARGGAMKVKYYELSRDQQCRWSSSCSLTLNTSVGVLGNEKTKKEVWWIVVINSGYSELQKWSSNHAQARCAPTPQLATDQNLILRLNDPKMLFPKQQRQREEPRSTFETETYHSPDITWCQVLISLSTLDLRKSKKEHKTAPATTARSLYFWLLVSAEPMMKKRLETCWF